MNCQLALPATLPAFVAYQEQLIGRTLTAEEQEADAKFLEVFNGVATGELDGQTVLANIDRLTQEKQTPCVLQLLAAARHWVQHAEEAWKGGGKG